jgi:hypothetical protein
MKIPSRAWGFVRAGLNGSFGVTVPNFGTGGTEDNPLLNDVDAGDEAAGVEFCPVFAAQASSGTLTVRTNGGLSFVGAADGTYVIPYSLYTFTPGDAASVDEGDTDVTINVGAGASIDLVIQDATHAHAADSMALTIDAFLAVADALHGHAAENVIISLAGVANLVIADALHAHTADAIVLSSASVLAIQDALHGHSVENLAITAESGVNLLVADSLHAHSADGVALTVDAWLAIADAVHAHSADNVIITPSGAFVWTGESYRRINRGFVRSALSGEARTPLRGLSS